MCFLPAVVIMWLILNHAIWLFFCLTSVKRRRNAFYAIDDTLFVHRNSRAGRLLVEFELWMNDGCICAWSADRFVWLFICWVSSSVGLHANLHHRFHDPKPTSPRVHAARYLIKPRSSFYSPWVMSALGIADDDCDNKSNNKHCK